MDGMSHAAKLITSLTNDRVKAIRALDMRKERKETGLFVVEGAALLMSARDKGFKPETIAYRPGQSDSAAVRDLVAWALSSGVEVMEVSEPVLEKLASKENPQSMLGVFRQKWAEAPAPARVGEDATWLTLEEIRDPGNLGTIIRTADATGVSGIILAGNCCDPFSRECVRATMGSIFALPLVRMERESFLGWRSGWTGDVAGLHLKGREDFRTAKLKSPVLLVMGSEGPGLSDSFTRTCTRLLRIPMAGDLDSLNLAVATALALYQVRGAQLKMQPGS
jgi:TrmH family RNA methyltransferase